MLAQIDEFAVCYKLANLDKERLLRIVCDLFNYGDLTFHASHDI